MKYAIVETGGKQYKAVEGETFEVDRLPVEIGVNIKLEQVLMLVDGENYTVGTPVVKETPVWTRVIEHFRGEKVIIFNYSPKKRIRVKTGHRQNYTRLLVEQIGGSTLVEKVVVKEEAPKVEKPKEEKPKAVAAKKPASKTTAKVPVKKETKPAPKKTAPKAETVKKAPAKKTTKPAAK